MHDRSMRWVLLSMNTSNSGSHTLLTLLNKTMTSGRPPPVKTSRPGNRNGDLRLTHIGPFCATLRGWQLTNKFIAMSKHLPRNLDFNCVLGQKVKRQFQFLLSAIIYRQSNSGAVSCFVCTNMRMPHRMLAAHVAQRVVPGVGLSKCHTRDACRLHAGCMQPACSLHAGCYILHAGCCNLQPPAYDRMQAACSLLHPACSLLQPAATCNLLHTIVFTKCATIGTTFRRPRRAGRRRRRAGRRRLHFGGDSLQKSDHVNHVIELT